MERALVPFRLRACKAIDVALNKQEFIGQNKNNIFTSNGTSIKLEKL